MTSGPRKRRTGPSIDEFLRDEEARQRAREEALRPPVDHDFEHIPNDDDPLDPGLTTRERNEFRSTLAEIARRAREALRLFRAMPSQEAFFASHASERIARGGNRAGKTLIAAVEFARAVTGQDPHGKYPKKNGIAVCVGLNYSHTAKVMYKKLFKPGAFKIIKDAETGDWRAWNPSDPDDMARESEAKPAPPLIPKRFYNEKDIAWENKREESPSSIKLKNGWEIWFYSSLGPPPNGIAVHIVWFDEEIEHPKWYPEMAARLLDHIAIDKFTGLPIGGKFVWSATPQAATQVLYDLCKKAQATRNEPRPTTAEFYYNLLANEYMSQRAKDEFVEKIGGNEDELRVRVYGDFAITGVRIYSEFQPKGVHRIESFPIPDDWPIYLAIDPGRQVAAILFLAVPPPIHPVFGGCRIFFDELYIKRANAAIVAQALQEKMNGRPIMDWVVDNHAMRQTEIGSGQTIGQQYKKAFKKKGLASQLRGTSFAIGADDVTAGIEAARTGLHPVDGRIENLFMMDKLPNFQWEIERYSYKRTPKGVVTDQPLQVDNHLMDCFRYHAQRRWKYVKPEKPRVVPKIVQYVREKKKRQIAQEHGGDPNVLMW